jgi:hypothetical protein
LAGVDESVAVHDTAVIPAPKAVPDAGAHCTVTGETPPDTDGKE